MAHYKCPTSIEIRDALVRTATGKLQKPGGNPTRALETHCVDLRQICRLSSPDAHDRPVGLAQLELLELARRGADESIPNLDRPSDTCSGPSVTDSAR